MEKYCLYLFYVTLLTVPVYLVVYFVASDYNERIKMAAKDFTTNNDSVGIQTRDGFLKDVTDKIKVQSAHLEMNVTEEITSRHRTFSIMFYSPKQGRFTQSTKTLNMTKCDYTNCKVRIERNVSPGCFEDDVIVFQGNRMPLVVPRRRNKNQVFVFFDNEPPVYVHFTKLKRHPYRHEFNWTMTYRSDSDIFCPYGRIYKNKDSSHLFRTPTQATAFREKDDSRKDNPNDQTYKHRNDQKTTRERSENNVETLQEDIRNRGIFRSKTKLSLWLVSHCSTPSKREVYVDQMRNYTTVEQFGACNEKGRHSKTSFLNQNLDKYKFYLAFENSLCNKYVTEKFYKWFTRDVITVIRAGRGCVEHFPKGTYVDASDFPSAKDLAEYLEKLGSDEDEYIKYLKRKHEYSVVQERESNHMAFCDLCKKMNHLEGNRNSVKDMYTWWNENQCSAVR